MVFVKVKYFYIKICSKLLGSREKFHFAEYFVTPAFVKTTFHRISLRSLKHFSVFSLSLVLVHFYETTW
jgi:hypothetical protein